MPLSERRCMLLQTALVVVSEETRSVVAACSHAQGVITIMNAAVGDRALQLWGCQQLMKIGFNGEHDASLPQTTV
jgi:hypothetical protein